jgi:hypothetical protein
MFLLNAHDQEVKLGWTLTFNKAHPVDFFNELPLKNDDYVYEVELTRNSYGQPVPVKEVLRTAQPGPGYRECFKLLENRNGRSQVFDRKTNRLIEFNKASSEDDDGRDKGENNLTKSDPNTSPIQKGIMGKPRTLDEEELLLGKMKFINEYPDSSAVRIFLSHFAFYPGFDVSRSSALRTKPSEIKPITILFESGENLGAVLHEIFTRHDFKASAEEVLDYCRGAYPHIESISAETAFSNPVGISLRVYEKNMGWPMELWDLSDGCLRFLCLATALLNPMPPSFMAFDEPEAGLHPRLLPIVADMIKTASERTQVLITTHSPDLLNCFDLEHIAVMTRDEDRINWNRPVNRQSLRKMLEQVEGETLGDLHRSGELESLG